jgi:tetratricopeptide (TPR) repeat protein
MRFFFVALSMAAGIASAQHSHPQDPEKPVALLKGLGIHRYQIRTAQPRAQLFFDQGLKLLYGFNRYESLRSFRKASELDPKALMPYWGIAMAQGPHINMDLDGDYVPKEYCAALDKGRPLRAAAPPHEQAIFDAALIRCPADQPRAYLSLMREAARRFPDDLEIQTFFAESLMIPPRWKWFTPAGLPAEGMDEALQVLEQVMRRNPLHPGANHFYIHAVEMSRSPERAIPSAQRLMGIVPAAGHLVHMPGHIWLALGDYQTTIDVNERGAQVDREYFAATGVTTSGYGGYYVHNLHFIAYAKQMQGRKADSLKAAREVAAAAAPFAEQMPGMVDAFLPWPTFAALRFQQWDTLLAAKAPNEKLVASKALWHFSRGVAFAAKRQRAEAMREKTAFAAARARVPASWIWLNNKASDVLSIAAASLDARLAATNREAIPFWRKAVEIEDQLVYDEPPPWYYPVRESLGAALLRSGQAAEAEAVFREGLRRKPRNGRMLFGLLESLKAQKKDHGARLVQAEFTEAWKHADIVLRLADF